MSDSNSAVLQRAYELVESGQSEEARSLVESVLEAEQSNPDAWWIYAHAVDDPVKARQALNEVLALDPEYPGANELVGVLDSQYPDAADAAKTATPLLLLAALGGHGELPSSEAVWIPETPAEPDATAEAEPEPSFVSQVPPTPPPPAMPPEKRRIVPWWWYVAVGAVALLLLAVFVFVFGRLTGPTIITDSDTNSTLVAVEPTLDTGAQSAQETVSAGGLATLEPGVLVTAEVGGSDQTPVGLEGTSEPLLPGEAGIATSESSLPVVVATLPLESFVTLTPASPEPVVTEGGAESTPEPTEEAGLATEAAQPGAEGGGEATNEAGGETGQATEVAAGIVVPQAVVVIMPAETLNRLVTALSAYSTPPETSLTTETTPLGETLVASFCTQEGPELRDLTRQVMDTVAAAAPVMVDTTSAVGVRAVDCQTGQTLRLIVVDRGTATLYTQGEINREGFESQWVSL
ncbi:MAG: hypothetical protein U0452_01165 [Anaerolineae bacterium]